jgi:IS30 family transposase
VSPPRKRKGRPRKLSSRDARRIALIASNSSKSIAQIKAECSLNVHPKTIRRSLQRNSNLCWKKMCSAPVLKDHHKRQRLVFAEENIDRDWKKVILYD